MKVVDRKKSMKFADETELIKTVLSKDSSRIVQIAAQHRERDQEKVVAQN